MGQERRGGYPPLWAAIESIAPKIGCPANPLHTRVRTPEIGTGLRDDVVSDERERIEALERENNELRPPTRF